jgi:hypothetical protein
MSEQNPWVVVATFTEELAPHIQPLMDSVATVCKAVVAVDQKLLLKQTVDLTERE